MTSMKHRILFLGTTNGLYLGEENGAFKTKLIGFEGKGVFRAPVHVDQDDPSLLYAGTTRAGLWRSRDRGDTWEEINNGLVHKDVWSIAQHKSGTLFAGTSPAGVLMSNDNGESWSECERLQLLPTTKGWHGPQPPHVSRMKGLAVSADETPLIYGTIEEGWAVRSMDGGESWEQIDNGIDHDGHWVSLMLSDPKVVVASCGKGMFRSTDAGEHWTAVNEGLGVRKYSAAPLATNAKTPRVLLAGVTEFGPGQWFRRPEGGNSAFARSDDEGQTWTVSTRGLPQPCVTVPRALASDPEDPDTYFAGMADGSVWQTKDRGESFERIITGLPDVMAITVAYR